MLREILAGAEFAVIQEPLGRRLLAWLSEWPMRALQWLLDLAGDGPDLWQTVALVLIAALLVAASVAGYRRIGKRRGRGAPSAEPPASIPRGADEWLQVAAARSARGELRSAATALYRGVLLILDRDGTLSYHTSKTPGDYAAAMARDSGAARFLAAFQDFSFGVRQPSRAGYASLSRAAADATSKADERVGP